MALHYKLERMRELGMKSTCVDNITETEKQTIIINQTHIYVRVLGFEKIIKRESINQITFMFDGNHHDLVVEYS